MDGPRRKHVLIVLDGAADRARLSGRSPLDLARTPHLDFLAREGVCGRMQTLYADLPRGSIVALLGMLGWDPRRFCPGGRSSCELLALTGVSLADGDLAFRANLVRMEGRRLASYNAHYILTEQALPLVERLRAATRQRFPGFELYHNSDFRNSLVVRCAGVDPQMLTSPEPHESEGMEFDIARLIRGGDRAGQAVAEAINAYLLAVAWELASETANMLFPWSASRPLVLPSFAESTGFEGRAAIVGSMDFLHGMARAGGLEFVKVGNGRPDTDYAAKGRLVSELLAAGHDLVVCHINGPDEASHMGDVDLKIRCIEGIDAGVVGPTREYFRRHPGELGAVMAVPDHYTNFAAAGGDGERAAAHSIDVVPFAIWNGRERDSARSFSEEGVLAGRHGRAPVSHLQLLQLLGAVPAACPGPPP